MTSTWTPFPHVLITLDLDAEHPRWVVGTVDRDGLWHVRDWTPASEDNLPLTQRAERDDVAGWVCEVFEFRLVKLRRRVTTAVPTWSIVAYTPEPLSIPHQASEPNLERALEQARYG